jgi:hypothetical protein
MNLKFVSLLLIASNAFADGAVFLKKDDTAPFEGYELTPAQTEKVRENAIDLGSQLKINAALTDENSVITQRLTNSQQQDTFLSKQLEAEKDTGLLSKVGFFLAGCLVTTVVAYGATRAIK